MLRWPVDDRCGDKPPARVWDDRADAWLPAEVMPFCWGRFFREMLAATELRHRDGGGKPL